MTDLKKDLSLRISRLQKMMIEQDIDAILLSSNISLLYLFGQIYSGVVYLPRDGAIQHFVRRPQIYDDYDSVVYIRKIEDIATFIETENIRTLALELDELPYSEIVRQKNIFPKAKLANATTLLRCARMIKTPYEIEAIKNGAQQHMQVYKQIKGLYHTGMSDIDFQIEIEYLMRKYGSSGIFRCFGSTMEIHMGSLLAGDNALSPSPYDFALGGAGSSTLPLGASGKPLKEGTSVMIDMAGNYGTYLTDISRTYSIGKLTDEAYRLHNLSIRMHREVMQRAAIGDTCGEIHLRCLQIAEEKNAKDLFMGVGQQAQFVGHGLGLQINELPVLTQRSKETLKENMVIAFEPKFVLPGVGAVGIENTYLVSSSGIENLSPIEEHIIDLVN